MDADRTDPPGRPVPPPRAAALAGLPGLPDVAGHLLSSDSPVHLELSLLGEAVVDDPLLGALQARTAHTAVAVAVTDTRSDARTADLPPVDELRSYLGVPLTGPDGEVVGALGAVGSEPRDWSTRDVSLLEDLARAVVGQLEVRRLSERVEDGELRWQVAVEAAGLGSFAWDLSAGDLELDERARALFELAGGPRQSVAVAFGQVHPDDRAALDAAVEGAVRRGEDLRAECRVVQPEGGARWVSCRGRVVAGASGRRDRLVGTVHDVTELRAARDDAARLLERMVTGFVALDRDWLVTYVNSVAAAVLGTPAAELVGRSLWDVSPGLYGTEFGRQYRHALATGETVQVEAHYPELQRWFEVRAVPSPEGLSLYFLDVTRRRADQALAEAATARLELLAAVSAELVDAGLDVEGAVARLGQVVVPVLADWCIVSLTGAGGALRDVGVWHRDAAALPLAREYTAHRLEGRTDLGPIQRARESSQTVVVPGGLTAAVLPTLGCSLARAALSELAPESAVVVPLLARGQMAGILTLLRSADRPGASEAEVAVAHEVGTRAALALENARLYGEQRSLAEGLQRSLLTTPPETGAGQIAVRYVPAAEVASVGGDWFDSFLQDDGTTVLVIGDVMGHDTVAAAAMGQLRSLLRGIAWHSGGGPAAVLEGLDAAMRGLQVDTTASAVVATLRAPGPGGLARLRWSNAGHPPPLAVSAGGEVSVLLGRDADLLLGIDPHGARAEQVADLEPGSTVLLFTDGLIERRGQDLDEGLALLRGVLGELAHLPVEQLCDAVLARMLPPAAEDDVALVAVRLPAA